MPVGSRVWYCCDNGSLLTNGQSDVIHCTPAGNGVPAHHIAQVLVYIKCLFNLFLPYLFFLLNALLIYDK